MTQTEALRLALEALEGADEIDCDMRDAVTAIKEALAESEFIKHEVENADDWSEWVCPDPKNYLMKCCDCGLVHEAQFGVVRYKSETERDDCDIVNDPNLQAVFRMRRSEELTPEDTAHRVGGLPMAEPEQDWIERERAVGYREGHRAALAQRTWIGLTDEEVKKIVGSDRYTDLLKEVVQIVETKLRSKNNG
jgi:hypothetical protein